MTEPALVTVSKQADGIVVLTLNDPETRNAMSEAMGVQFAARVRELSTDSAVRVVVLTGAAKAFSGGGHLDMLFEKTKLSREENQRRMEEFYANFLSIRSLAVPCIAAINGHAIGAGLCLALACDVRIAHAHAKLGANFVHLGLHPGMGATHFLPEIVGSARAAELLLFGKILSAPEALKYGLVHEVVDAEGFDARVHAAARALSEVGPQAVQALKQSLLLAQQESLAVCLAREAEMQARDYVGPEFLEGITAARDKRKPKF